MDVKESKKVVNIQGMVFGRLTVISLHEKGGSGVHATWNCSCECGKNIIVRGSALRRKLGGTRSCGCINKDTPPGRTHGMSGTREYKSWDAMIARCYNPKNNRFYMYGERGIKVDPYWRDFNNFFEDMGIRPQGKSLDRINSNKDYTKTNCKWSTPKEQANNRRNNVKR